MTKKVFTDKRPVEYNNKSDVELIELLDSGTLSEWQRDAIKSLLDKRTKIVIQDLTRVIQNNETTTSKYNEALRKLTTWILIFTIVMTIATVMSIFKK